ncbi:MAG: DHA2 family efflux MFS transporter permease subunit [Actinomycetota bacterium]
MQLTDDTRKWWVLGAMCVTLFMVLFDESVVGVAVDTIQLDLGMTELAGHWVVNAYLLVLAAFVAVGGKAADLFGYRRVFIVGSVIFGGASLWCALAPNGTMLIAARGVQGLGAAIVFPLSLALAMIVFPPAQRGMAIGVLGLAGTTGLALGPLTGGLLIEFLDWRWIFTVNVIAAVAITALVAAVWREPPRSGGGPRFDVPGLLTLVLALSALVFAVMQGGEWGWTSPITFALFVVAIASGCAFWFIESSRDDPLIEVELFRSARFSAFNVGVFMAQFSKATVLVFLPLYLQQQLGYSAIEAGLALLPGLVPNVLFALPAGRLVDRVGSTRPLLLGLGGLVLAHIALAALVDVDNYLALLPALLLWGPAVLYTFQGALTGVANSVAVEQQGQASGISNEAQMLGGAIGIAVMSALQTSGARWDVVFGVSAATALAVVLFAWRALRTAPQAQ